MGLFSRMKAKKHEEQYRLQQEAERAAQEAQKRAESDLLYQEYENALKEEQIESDQRASLMDFPSVPFTKESLDWWLGAHIDMDKYADVKIIASFKAAILNESKSFCDLGPLLVEVSDMIQKGEADVSFGKWLIRAFVASYDIQYGGEYSAGDAKFAAHYKAVLNYLDSEEAKPADAYLYLGEPAARLDIFGAVDQYLQATYYWTGHPIFQKFAAFSGLVGYTRFDYTPSHLKFSTVSPVPSDVASNARHIKKDVYSQLVVLESGRQVRRPFSRNDYVTPRGRWNEDIERIFGAKHYNTAHIYCDIAAIYAHSYGWRDSEVRIGCMEYCRRNMGESRVNAMLIYWTQQHPEWKIIQKDCIGPYSDKCIRLSSSGHSPQEIDHLLVGPYGVIQIETKNYCGYINLRKNKEGSPRFYCTPFDSYDSKEVPHDPIEQVRSHDVTLHRILGDIPLRSIICISAPGSVIKDTPEEIAKICPYDVIDYVNLDDYLSQMQNILAAKTRIPYDVNEIVRKIEGAKVRNLLRGETPEYPADPSTLSPDMPRM